MAHEGLPDSVAQPKPALSCWDADLAALPKTAAHRLQRGVRGAATVQTMGAHSPPAAVGGDGLMVGWLSGDGQMGAHSPADAAACPEMGAHLGFADASGLMPAAAAV